MHVDSTLRLGSAEFPHDNPRLDACTVWVETGGACAPRCESAPIQAPASAAASASPADAQFRCALRDAARAFGPLDEDVLASLLVGITPTVLNDEVRDALIAGRILESRGSTVAIHPDYQATCRAWHAVLSGESTDLAACGESTLDAFAAGLLAHLLGVPQQFSVIRQRLRRRGVAAFGVVDVGGPSTTA